MKQALIPHLKAHILSVLIFLVCTAAFAQSYPRDLFEQARMLDESNQNLTEAITLYRQAASLAGEERAMAAQAQYRVGILFDRLGKADEALGAFQLIVRDYAEQNELVRYAQSRIEAVQRRRDVEVAGPPDIILRQIWTGPDVDTFGSPSPDGRYLSFVDWSTGDLAIRDLKTGENRRLTNKGTWAESNAFAMHSIFSPDGSKIAYAWDTAGSGYQLCEIGIDGSGYRVISNDSSISWIQPVAWSPDGGKILAGRSHDNENSAAGLFSVENGRFHELASVGERDPQHATFSPDGEFIVSDLVSSRDPDNREIYGIDPNTGSVWAIIEHPSEDLLLGWVPGTDFILFASDRMVEPSLWLQKVTNRQANGEPRLIKAGAEELEPLNFSEDGSFFYSIGAETRDIFVASIDLKTGKTTKEPEAINTQFEGIDRLARFSQDGRSIIYQSIRDLNRGDEEDRYYVIYDLQTGESRQLRLDLQSSIVALWSEDGNTLFVDGTDKENRVGLFKVDAATGESTRLKGTSEYNIRRPFHVSADETYIYLQVWMDDGSGIVRHNLETGDGTLLIEGRQSNAAISPDEKYIAYVDDATGKQIVVAPIDGGDGKVIRTLDPDDPWPIDLTWSPDGNSILYILNDPSSNQARELWSVPIDGGEAKKFELAMEGMRDLRLHPDGERVVFSAGKSAAEIWVMENFIPKEETLQ